MDQNELEHLKARAEFLARKHGLKVVMHRDHSGALHVELTHAGSRNFLSIKDASPCSNFAEAERFIDQMLERAGAYIAP